MVGKESRECVTLECQQQKIFGIFHRPSGKPTFPVVVMLHGFASSKLGTKRAWVTLAEALTTVGIGAFRFDFRGCGDSEGDLSQMTLEGFLSDVRVVFAHLKREGYERLGTFGSSFGGALGALSAPELPVRSLALWAPVASGALWLQDQLARHPELADVTLPEAFTTFRGMQLLPEFCEQYGQMSIEEPLSRCGEIPLLHCHGESDLTISLAHQALYRKAREGARAQSRFLLYPETDHALGEQKVFPEVVKELVAWYQETL